MKKHANIPLFIPHLGCPNLCVFCNQRSISGHNSFDPSSVRGEIETALSTVQEGIIPEIAFFGGSFTGIDRELMKYLLGIAKEYNDAGKTRGIRLSTRPDYIDDEILTILGQYGVTDIELGLQSMDDRVLAASKRGHDAKCAENACRAVKAYGFNLVGQMMVGLPLSDTENEVMTAEKICDLGADGARIYPTVVFRDTELCRMAESGVYSPLGNEEAAVRTADILRVFVKRDVPVIRVGLCASENLSSENCVMGGANHSAVGELAMNLLYRDIIGEKLKKAKVPSGAIVTVNVAPGETSKAVGQKRSNINRFLEEYCLRGMKVTEKAGLSDYEVNIYFTLK